MTTLAERGVYLALDRLRSGRLTVVGSDGREHTFEGEGPGPDARVEVKADHVARRLVTGGAMALAETYMDGGWDTPDLSAVLEVGAANLPHPKPRPRVLHDPLGPLRHAVRANTRRGSRRNIAAHYDLGNDFYSLWLDPTMTYSCALFEDAGDLESAQKAKYRRMADIAGVGPDASVLEIGCGWGGFAALAAAEKECRVTGLTLSEQQHDEAAERVAEAGVADRVEVRLEDYRDVQGTFDSVVSIEMLEAVGERWWPTYFRTLRERLASGGRAAIQTITIAPEFFEAYRRRPDFIQRYIFPGGMLPTPEHVTTIAAEQGLEVVESSFSGADYAETLGMWLERFEPVVGDIRALGFDDRFVRMWRYYLAGCRAAFKVGSVDLMRVGLAR